MRKIPLNGFGDLKAELLIMRLVPSAHGGNRTGRIFAGVISGDWVAKVLYDNDFASKSTNQKIHDSFDLINAITAVVKCTSS